MPGRVRVRGIYSTALTALLLERGFTIVEPSPAIQQRLGLPENTAPPEVTVSDRADRQGVWIEGLREAVAEVVAVLKESIPEALFHLEQASPPRRAHASLAALARLAARAQAEFPSPAKDRLDRLRSRYTPTLPGHHYLKAVDPAAVDAAEQEAAKGADSLEDLARRLKAELIHARYAEGAEIRVCHSKAGSEGFEHRGQVKELRPDGTLVLARTFQPGGTYDGLKLPKEPGDFGLVELHENRWWGRRAYFRADGTPLGEIYNIHTPPELYPDHVRYLDLEVDLVRTTDGGVTVVDEAELRRKLEKGLLSEVLGARAWMEACALKDALRERAFPA